MKWHSIHHPGLVATKKESIYCIIVFNEEILDVDTILNYFWEILFYNLNIISKKKTHKEIKKNPYDLKQRVIQLVIHRNTRDVFNCSCPEDPRFRDDSAVGGAVIFPYKEQEFIGTKI